MIEIGKKLNGRYHIIGKDGSGGMANVYLAHDLILDRDVAVKSCALTSKTIKPPSDVFSVKH